MPAIGPTLPPHLAKRKRDESGGSSAEDKRRRVGPLLPDEPAQTLAEKRVDADEPAEGEKRRAGPLLPPSEQPVQGPSEKRRAGPVLPPSEQPVRGPSEKRRVAGPSLPPPDERPAQSGDGDSDDDSDDLGPALPGAEDSDDDFGPALPSAADDYGNDIGPAPSAASAPEQPRKAARDEWMLAPPTADDWVSRMDPSKLKNRRFNSGKAREPQKADSSLWTETAEEKRKRLEDEMMGVKKPDRAEAKSARRDAEAKEKARKIDEYNEKNRAASLYDQHQKTNPEEDDPSKRAFDREKDIGGSQLTHADRKRMMSRAADFGSRFSKGSYL